MNIDIGQTIILLNDKFGGISINLSSTGEYTIVSNGPPVNVQQCSNIEVKQIISKPIKSINYNQTAFSNMTVHGNIDVISITQSINNE